MLRILPTSALSLARIIGKSPDCVKLLDTKGQLIWMNENGLCAMEIDAFETVANQQWASLWPVEEKDRVTRSMPLALAEGTASFTAPCATAKGQDRWWDVAVHPVDDDQGQHVGFLSISRDVTDRETQRIALETVIAEMRHRLKNSYAMVCSLMNGLARGHDDRTAFAHDVQQRVSALAEAQALFADDRPESLLSPLLESIIAPFIGQPQTTIALTCDATLMIERRTADCVALAMGEFAVNSAKYGAICHGGTIGIAADQADGLLRLTWSEAATQPVTTTSREGGQGLGLIRRMLAVNGAVFSIDWQPHGPRAEILFKTGFSQASA